MFNEANVSKRLRKLVRGRVLVFTTSKQIEFLTEDLSLSIPLFGREDNPYAPIGGLTFQVELEGYLTFDEGSQIKIHDLGPYTGGDFDPTKFVLTYPCDPFIPIITRSQLTRYGSLSVYISTINGTESLRELEVIRKDRQPFSEAEIRKFGPGRPYDLGTLYRLQSF